MKVFNFIYKHVPKKEPEPIKLNTRVVEKPLGARKLFMIEVLTALLRVDKNFLLYVSKETWCLLVDNVFDHPENSIYHAAFLKLFIEMFKFRDENLYVTVIISQNIMAKILDFYQRAVTAKEYDMPYTDGTMLETMSLWVEIIDTYFDGNKCYPSFAA